MAKREPKLLRLRVAAHELGLHPITVRRWIKAGRIQVIPVGREVRIPRTEVKRLVGKVDGRLLVLYGRVSGHGQKDDLDIQIQRLQAWAAAERKGVETLVLSDIGSDSKRLDVSCSGFSSWSARTKWERWRLRMRIV